MSHDEPPQPRRAASTSHDDAAASYRTPADAPHLQQAGALTPLRRWAANASDSTFNAIAGAVGGFTSGIVTCPLDVIKTKLQAQGASTLMDNGRHVGHPKLYNGLVGTAKVIWRQEGIRGMYRGLGPIVLGYLPTWAVWFTVYNDSKSWLAQYSGMPTFLHSLQHSFYPASPAINLDRKRHQR